MLGFASVSLGPESKLGRSCVPEDRPFFFCSFFLPSYLFFFLPFFPATDGRSQLRMGLTAQASTKLACHSDV